MKHVPYLSLIIIEFIIILVLGFELYKRRPAANNESRQADAGSPYWTPPDTNKIPAGPPGDLIRYGRELVVHTAVYIGPRGKISLAANGLSCQNCHIEAGTRPLGNNFFKVASCYPKYRPRRDGYVSIADRVNGCMERSMNGSAIDTATREMKAFIAYFKWLGKGVDKQTPLPGDGMGKLAWLKRAADPAKGKIVFLTLCQACHGKHGEGKLRENSVEYQYPPLWGPHSYNVGAGMYRLSHFAAYVKNNMPFGTTYHDPLLTDEQAWDVAAFVNSLPHPCFAGIGQDWPKIADKPFDYPFGPYADGRSEIHHKYGPYKPQGK